MMYNLDNLFMCVTNQEQKSLFFQQRTRPTVVNYDDEQEYMVMSWCEI